MYIWDELFTFVLPPQADQERWESGLIHQFAKLAYSIRVPGVRIPPSPQPNPKPAAGSAGNSFYHGAESFLSFQLLHHFVPVTPADGDLIFAYPDGVAGIGVDVVAAYDIGAVNPDEFLLWQ